MEEEDSINIYSKEQNPILFEHNEQISDDEQVRKSFLLFFDSSGSDK
jgi:hypothetical protein